MAVMAATTISKKKTVKVPLLTMLPLPHLRIDVVEFTLSVRLNSIQTFTSDYQVSKIKINTNDNTASTSTSTDRTVPDRWGKVMDTRTTFGSSATSSRFKAATTQKGEHVTIKTAKKYSLDINLKAKQDQLPGGLEKLFEIL